MCSILCSCHFEKRNRGVAKNIKSSWKGGRERGGREGEGREGEGRGEGRKGRGERNRGKRVGENGRKEE